MNRTDGVGVVPYLNKCCGGKLNPSNWSLTSEKVMKIAAVILAICALSILVTSLMVTYPQAAGAFFTIFGLVSVLAIITLVVSTVKYCRQRGANEIGTKVKERVRELEENAGKGTSQLGDGIQIVTRNTLDTLPVGND